MRIEKYVHSCLLLSHEGHKLLFDPGKFSFVDGRVDPGIFHDVQAIVLTHAHPDHLAPIEIAQIVQASGARIYGNSEVANKLKGHGLHVRPVTNAEFTCGPFRLRPLPVRHAPMLADKPPKVTAFVVNSRLLVPGDSFDPSLERFKDIEALALPVMAPFLTEIEALRFAQSLSPKHVIPVHDGYVRDYFLTQRYDTYEHYMRQQNIVFHRLEKVGDGFELA